MGSAKWVDLSGNMGMGNKKKKREIVYSVFTGCELNYVQKDL